MRRSGWHAGSGDRLRAACGCMHGRSGQASGGKIVGCEGCRYGAGDQARRAAGAAGAWVRTSIEGTSGTGRIRVEVASAIAELLSKFGCGQTAEGVGSTFGGRPSDHPMRTIILQLLRMLGKRSFLTWLRFALLQQDLWAGAQGRALSPKIMGLTGAMSQTGSLIPSAMLPVGGCRRRYTKSRQLGDLRTQKIRRNGISAMRRQARNPPPVLT